MGKTTGIYRAQYPAGTRVRVASRADLQNFLQTWKLHDPLAPEQLNYAGQVAEVQSVGFYHGGDELYQLQGVPGIWHERCLKPAP